MADTDSTTSAPASSTSGSPGAGGAASPASPSNASPPNPSEVTLTAYEALPTVPWWQMPNSDKMQTLSALLSGAEEPADDAQRDLLTKLTSAQQTLADATLARSAVGIQLANADSKLAAAQAQVQTAMQALFPDAPSPAP